MPRKGDETYQQRARAILASVPAPTDPALLRTLKTRPRPSLDVRIAAIPEEWRELQQRALEKWGRTRSGKTLKSLGQKAHAPMLPNPTNSWWFQGVVSMPPKPIPNKTDYPMFYLSIGHTAQYSKQLSDSDYKVSHHLPVILVCVMLGEMAVKYHEIEVGTKVIGGGYFQSFPAARGMRTLTVLGSLEILPKEESRGEETSDPSTVSESDIQTLLDLQRGVQCQEGQ